MKKIVLLLSIFAGFALSASAQCTPDTTHFTSSTFVYPSSLDTIHGGQAFSGVISIVVPDSLSLGDFVPALSGLNENAYIDSVKFDSITGYPTGITSVSNPALNTTWLKPGQFACAAFSGTTTAPTGSYPLSIYGSGCGHFTIPNVGTYDSCFQTFNFSNVYPYKLNVENPTGISDISEGLNFNIYPNPNQGNFSVIISTVAQMSGDMSVIDELGRVIYTQVLDVAGVKQIPLALNNVSPGVYVLMVNANGKRSVKQFVVK